jgi:flagellar biosynthesis/type III secretory pathway M-ring protein FliF/YscJ
MSETDIKRFTQLVKESIGLKDDRGDQLNVLNQAFKSNGRCRRSRAAAMAAALGDSAGKQIVGAAWCWWWRCWCCGR